MHVAHTPQKQSEQKLTYRFTMMTGPARGTRSKNPQMDKLHRLGSVTDPQGRKTASKMVVSTKSPKSPKRRKEKSSTKRQLQKMRDQIAALSEAVMGTAETARPGHWRDTPASHSSTPAGGNLPRPGIPHTAQPLMPIYSVTRGPPTVPPPYPISLAHMGPPPAPEALIA